MNKKIYALILCVIILSLTALVSFADASMPVLIDDAGLLTQSEQDDISERLESVANDINFQLVIITVDSLNGYDVDLTAQSYFEQGNYGFGEYNDGALLLISMEERDVCIYSNQIDNDAIREKITPYLSSGDYYGAFNKFIDECKSHFSFHFGKNLLISLAIGLIIAFIVTASMKSQMKTVEKKSNASDYVKDNSMNLTCTRDTFLYFTVTKTPRPKSNNSSGGRSHSSSSGKF